MERWVEFLQALGSYSAIMLLLAIPPIVSDLSLINYHLSKTTTFLIFNILFIDSFCNIEVTE